MVVSQNGGRSADPRTEPVQRRAALTVAVHPPPRSEAVPAGAPGRIAVLLPCRNEESTIADVIADFHRALPQATVYVYDNASTDRTAAVARRAGVTVAHVRRPGKGNVMRQMFADVDADVYLMADGDGTYDASDAPVLVAALREHHLDMVVGRRVDREESGTAYRRGHRLGNRLLTATVRWIFGKGPEDMLSGYRVFSRRYVRSFPATSRGFEIETEMTVHALDLGVPFLEVPTPYRARPPASTSKLRAIPDGLRILRCILVLCKEYRPVRFFGALIGAISLFGAIAVALRPWDVPETPGTGRQVFLICAALVFGLMNVGLILDSVSRHQRELKRLLYLAATDRSPITTHQPMRSA